MTAKKNGSRPSGVLLILYVCLFAAVGTYALPLLRFKMPPIGEKSWSILDVTRMIPKMVKPKSEEKKMFEIKTDVDFMDILNKIAPKDPQTNQPQKVSPVFMLGVFVPICLVLSYFLILLGFLVAPWGRGGALGWSSGLTVLTSLYALGGTFYLGKAAARSFHESVSKAAEGFLGGITKNFVPEITLQPDTALYALAVLAVLIFLINRFARGKA